MATKSKTASTPKTFTNAIDMLRDEMATSTTRYVQVVGEFMTDYLLEHPEDQDTVLNSGKSIKGSVEQMKTEAAKHKEFNVAVLDDETAFGIVLKYFGLKDKRGKKGPGETGETTFSPAVTTPLPPDPVDPFDLDALIASAASGLSPSASAAPGETRAPDLSEGAGRETGVGM